MKTATRTSVPGTQLHLLVVSVNEHEVIGVDLASGAFVRAQGECGARVHPFDVAASTIAGEPVDAPHAPESVELATPPRVVGHLSRRRAERYLRALTHPRGGNLLGIADAAVPFWTLTGDRPSVSVVIPTAGPAVLRVGHGFRCRFLWRTHDHDLPLTDLRAESLLAATGRSRFSGDDLARVLGFHPHRLVVALSPPADGMCEKVVAALLPRR